MAERTAAHAATGKRKTAVARVRLLPGDGKISVNRRTLDEYFGRPTSRMIVNQPLELTSTKGYVRRRRQRGGRRRLGAGVGDPPRHHPRADGRQPGFRPALKKAGFVTRDPREVERKKYGRHKARKRPQYSKR